MTTPERYERLSVALADGVRAHHDLIGLVLLGSAAEEARSRRDEWSDHDFFALIRSGRGESVRPDLSWLPEKDRLVLTAREGGIGFVAVYDDGHVLEFALAEVGELAGAVVGEADVVVDDVTATTAALVVEARERAAAADRFDPVEDAELTLVKLLIGVGRVRRGERLNGGAFIRQWAVQHLVRAVRGRARVLSTRRDVNDPLRRFEQDFPEWGERIAAAIAQDEEAAALALYGLLCELAHGWDSFPARAAETVARRLGWA